MFRYVVLNWHDSSPVQLGLAALLVERLEAAPGWMRVLQADGLHAYITGHDRGGNTAYDLPPSRGVVLGRLFRRQSTMGTSTEVSLTPAETQQIADTQGRALTEQYWGRYVALLAARSGHGWVLRDPSGALPCFRTSVDGVNIVFSWLEDLFDVLLLQPKLSVDWDAIAAAMLLGQLGGRDTALNEVRQLLPGELTPFDPEGPAPQPLWSPIAIANEPMDRPAEEAAVRLRQTVRDCAQTWGLSYDRILLRLSGGLDSSILLNSLCPAIAPDRVAGINYYSPGPDGDERDYARLAASHAGVRLIEQHRDSGFDLRGVLNVARTPNPGSYLGRMGTGRLDANAAAAHGAQAIFTGSGGDQVFFQTRCTWPAADYLKLHGFGHGFLQAALDAARLGRVSLWRSLRNAVADQRFRGTPTSELGRYVALASPAAADRTRRTLHRFIHPELVSPSPLPIGKHNQVEDVMSSSEYYDPYLRHESPELVSPLKSQPVVELCLATPTYTLTHGGRSRGLARAAFAQDLPPEIARRRSKGSTEEHIALVLRRHLPFARDLLLGGELERQGLLNRKQAEVALAEQPSTTKTFVAEVHTCIAIESWIQRFR